MILRKCAERTHATPARHRGAESAKPILAVVREIAGITLEYGIEFDPEQATAEVIREDSDYSGIRVTLGVR